MLLFEETCFRGNLFRHYGNGNTFLGNVFPFPRFGFLYSESLSVANSANNDPAKKRRENLPARGRRRADKYLVQ